MNAPPDASLQKPLVEPWLQWVLRILVAVVLGLVAANLCARWWFFEGKAPAAHLELDPGDRIAARFALCSAAAALTGTWAVWELLGTLPRVTGRSRWLAVVTAGLALMPYLADRLMN